MSNTDFAKLLSGFPCTDQLQNTKRCARAIVVAAGLEIPQYTYYSNDRLYIAEKLREGWTLREETHLHETVREMAVLLGDIPLSRTQFILELSHEEAACLLAMMDYYAINALRMAVGEVVNPVILESTLSELLAMPKDEGLLALFFSICRGIGENAKKSVTNLLAKGLCRGEKEGYLLADKLIMLSSALAMPQGVVSLCLWESSNGQIINIPSFAVEGTLHDCLLVMVGADEVTICSLCTDALLDTIEEILSCPDMIQVDQQIVPNESWQCECSRINTGRFCPNCGKPRPTVTTTSSLNEQGWQCACGRRNKGTFCPKCGAKRP